MFLNKSENKKTSTGLKKNRELKKPVGFYLNNLN